MNMEFRRCKSLDVIVIIFCALVSGLISPSVDCSGLLQNHSNYSHPTPELQEDGRRPPPQEVFHYTSQLVDYNDLSRAERRSIINLKDDPYLSSKNLSLLRCSLYRFIFKVYQGNQLTSVEKIIRIPRADPKTKIDLTSPLGNSIELMWTTDYPECVDHYTLIVVDLRQYKRRIIRIASGNSSHEINALIPCTDYSVTLETYGQGNRRPDRSSVTERTSTANIELEYFEYSILENASVLFNWTKVEQVERCDGDYYVKLVLLDDDYSIVVEQHVPYTDNEIVVNGLKACHKYNVSLNANYFDVVASLGEIRTPFSEPSNINGLRFDKGQIELQWNAPEENGNCVANYTVTIDGVGEIITSKTVLGLEKLERCQKYSLSVQQRDIQGRKYTPVQIQQEMDIEELSESFEPNMKVDNETLTISWNAPAYQGKCKINYDLTWKGRRLEELEKSSSSLIIEDFQYCHNNSLQIDVTYKTLSRSFTKNVYYDGNSAHSVANLGYTYDEDSDSIVVTWEKPRGFEDCNYTYFLETNQFQTKVDEETYTIPWESTEIRVDVAIEHDFTGRSNVQSLTVRAPHPTVSGVKHTNSPDGTTKISWNKPDTEAKINKYIVIWDNKAREVSTNSISNSFTKCKDIDIVIYVQYNSGQTSANVSYTFNYIVAPESVKGLKHTFEFPNYKLSWDGSGTNVNCYKSFIITRSSSSEPAVVESFEYVFSSWTEDTEYTFEVIAMFDDSHKSKSVKHSFTTPGGAKNLIVTKNDEGTVEIEWSTPSNEDHEPEDYIVSVAGKNYTTTHTHITVELAFCVDLEIIVVVNYKSGVSKSATFTKKILAEPGKVRNIKTSWNKNLITWNAPDLNPKCASTYILKINDESFTASTNEFSDLKWEPCSSISVTITAQNSDGVQGIEANQKFAAPYAKISEVKNLNAVPTDKTLKINWDEPEKSKYCVSGYRVVVWDVDTAEVIYDHENETMFVFLEEMKACQSLTVQVTPLSSQGEGALLQQNATIQERASLPLAPVQAIEINSRSLRLRTTFEDDKYLCPLQEIQMKCVDSHDNIKSQITKLNRMTPERDLTFDLLVENMEPYEKYTCSATIQNVHDSWSAPSFSQTIQTLEDKSDPPSQFVVVEKTHNSIRVSWQEPLKPHGRITHYRVNVMEVSVASGVPARCRGPHDMLNLDSTVVEKEFVVKDVILPYTTYYVKVQAINGAGSGEETGDFVTTDTFTPEEPLDFKLEGVFGPFDVDEYNGSARISWKFPCFVNGPFESFIGMLTPQDSVDNDDLPIIFFEKKRMDEYAVELVNLRASVTYKVDLLTVCTDFNSTMVSESFTTLAAIPNYVPSTGITLNMSLNPSQSAVLSLSRRSLEEAGQVIFYSILISELDCQPEPEPQRKVMNSAKEWPGVRSWFEVQNDDCQKEYQATPIRCQFVLDSDLTRNDEPSEEYIQIEIGTENCTLKQPGEHCNGPLRTGTRYAVVLRLFTESGFTDSPYVVLQTISEINLMIIILLVITVMLGAFLAGLILILRKRNQDLVKESLLEGPKKISTAGDILTKNFPDHFDDLSKNNCERLNMEFNMINSGGQTPSTAFSVAKLNGAKNRYTNVLPYDFNRVILTKSEEDGHSDYINASYINGFRKPRDYIASQGPKMDSSYDFWRMIVQFKVSSVVMLTSYREGEKDKCHEYFPTNDSETLQFSDITIKCQKELDFPTHKKRVFSIERHNIIQTVHHYHFLKWPDHSCPNDPHDLIEFTKTVATERKHPAHPMIVHCSAGVGRTGTFIALDIALQQVRSEKKINVLEIVKDLRRQRMKMVQSFSQYLLIYQCIVIILKQHEATRSEPVWKRLSRKTNLSSAAGPSKVVNFGTHNFGMLQGKPLKEPSTSYRKDAAPANPAIAAELLGHATTSSSNAELLENNDLSLETIQRTATGQENYEFVACFEPEDSIS